MSLILESLQRAEEERKGGPVPEPEAPYEVPEPEHKPRRWLVWVVVGLAVGVAASITISLGIDGKETRVASVPPPQRAPGDGRDSAPPTVSFPASGDVQPDDKPKESQDRPSARPPIRTGPSMPEKAKTPDEGPVQSVSVPSPAAVPRPSSDDAAGGLNADTVDPSDPGKTAGMIGKSSPEPASGTSGSPALEEGRTDRKASAALPREIPPRISPNPSGAKDVQESLKPTATVSDNARTSPVNPRVSNTSPATQPPISKRPVKKTPRSGKIPLLRELPLETQARFKDLNLNVVVHEKDPAKSLVFINLGQYREGDRIGGNGLRVERILPDGVVLDYGQGRFKLKMYQ